MKMGKHIRQWFLVAVAGLSLATPWAQTRAIGESAPPVLLALAEHQPEAVIRVIVQKSASDTTEPEALVPSLKL